MYILYIIVLKIKLITNLHALSVAIHVPPNTGTGKCREQNLDLYMVFVDLTKVFDTISKDGLWQILRKIGCHDLFVDIIRSFHEGMVARVQY